MQQVFTVLAMLISQVVSIYSFSVNDSAGAVIDFSTFAGKKILLVNTASNSTDAAQYEKLEQLYQLYKDSLVIIAFPSNDFNNEPGDDATISSYVNGNYHIHFLLAGKTIVSGEHRSPLYNWLADQELNGMMNSKVHKDFYKYLINGDGKLIGIFTDEVDPLDSQIQDAVIN